MRESVRFETRKTIDDDSDRHLAQAAMLFFPSQELIARRCSAGDAEPVIDSGSSP